MPDDALVEQQVAATRIFLRPIANPFALGFLGLGGASLVTSGLELHWIPVSQSTQAAVLVMVFAPLLQTIACVFGFLSRDPVAATGMGLLAATWEVIGLDTLLAKPGSTSIALGTLLLLSGPSILVSAATAAKTKLVPALVMAVTAVRFTATGAYQLTGYHSVGHVAGYIGCVLAAVAVYGAVSLEIEDVMHHPVLPTLRRGLGREVLEPRLSLQVSEVASEAGVRRQL